MPTPLRVPIAVHVPPAVLFPDSSGSSGSSGSFGPGGNAPAVHFERPGLENASTANMVYLQVNNTKTNGSMLLRRRARALTLLCVCVKITIVAIVETYLSPICAATSLTCGYS
jgi:hypothetical protein